ncbi:hypothetical protein DBB42_16415 [Pseudomonas plecoglossicida]|uniref:Uncharacterized protein n=1 Tax=Pseudomonas plecoglossicida TaxID=70775 RepID=A0A2R7UIP4_PSEDL|nr:hypothetical protein DBB42_16415 [Pseudomonas plecoglossicida]
MCAIPVGAGLPAMGRKEAPDSYCNNPVVIQAFPTPVKDTLPRMPRRMMTVYSHLSPQLLDITRTPDV